jgi:hypothetical protein
MRYRKSCRVQSVLLRIIYCTDIPKRHRRTALGECLQGRITRYDVAINVLPFPAYNVLSIDHPSLSCSLLCIRYRVHDFAFLSRPGFQTPPRLIVNAVEQNAISAASSQIPATLSIPPSGESTSRLDLFLQMELLAPSLRLSSSAV